MTVIKAAAAKGGGMVERYIARSQPYIFGKIQKMPNYHQLDFLCLFVVCVCSSLFSVSVC